jgi:hypothetical protein
MKKVKVTKRMLESYVKKLLIEQSGTADFSLVSTSVINHINNVSADHGQMTIGNISNTRRAPSLGHSNVAEAIPAAGNSSSAKLARNQMVQGSPVYRLGELQAGETALYRAMAPGQTDGDPGENLLGAYLISSNVTISSRGMTNQQAYGANSTNVNGVEFMTFNGKRIKASLVTGMSSFPAFDVIAHNSENWYDDLTFNSNTGVLTLNIVAVSAKMSGNGELSRGRPSRGVSVGQDKMLISGHAHATQRMGAERALCALALSAIDQNQSAPIQTLKTGIISAQSGAVIGISNISDILNNAGVYSIELKGHDYFNMSIFPYFFGDESVAEITQLHTYLAFFRPFQNSAQTFDKKLTMTLPTGQPPTFGNLGGGPHPADAATQSVVDIDCFLSIGTTAEAVSRGAAPQLLRYPEKAGPATSSSLPLLSNGYKTLNTLCDEAAALIANIQKPGTIAHAKQAREDFLNNFKYKGTPLNSQHRAQIRETLFDQGTLPGVASALIVYDRLIAAEARLKASLQRQHTSCQGAVNDLAVRMAALEYQIKVRGGKQATTYLKFVDATSNLYQTSLNSFLPVVLGTLYQLNVGIKNYCKLTGLNPSASKPAGCHPDPPFEGLMTFRIQPETGIVASYNKLYGIADLLDVDFSQTQGLRPQGRSRTSPNSLPSTISENVNMFGELELLMQSALPSAEMTNTYVEYFQNLLEIVNYQKEIYSAYYEEYEKMAPQILDMISDEEADTTNDASQFLDTLKDKQNVNVPSPKFPPIPAPANQPFPEEEIEMVAESRLYEAILTDLMTASAKKQRAASQPKKLKLTKRQLQELMRRQLK